VNVANGGDYGNGDIRRFRLEVSWQPNTTYFILTDPRWIMLGGNPAGALNDGGPTGVVSERHPGSRPAYCPETCLV
jgi:hypothetical protein